MTDQSKKVSQLTIATSAANTDRVVLLSNPSTNAALKTISITNLNIPSTNTSSIGYILTTNTSGRAQWSAFTGVNYVTSITTANAYTATSNDSVLLVNPYVVGANVTITLPIESAIEGKEILVKNIDSTGNKKVRITTDDVGNAYLEDPVTGSFVTYYDLIETGQAETWIHDGNVYRHLNTARATPIFYTDANTYAQVVIKNASAGNNASSDLVLYNNAGNEAAGTGPFIDVGINSNTYSNSTYSIGSFSDAYVFNAGGNLAIGTSDDRTIVFHANGTTSEKKVMTVNSSAVLISTIFQTPQLTKQNH